ncbi:unnamed protein product [Trichobilharzia szidati]|nr:unnamed protein product [Trichobilharzia szidati]
MKLIVLFAILQTLVFSDSEGKDIYRNSRSNDHSYFDELLDGMIDPEMDPQEPTHPQMKPELPQTKPWIHPEEPMHPQMKPDIMTPAPKMNPQEPTHPQMKPEQPQLKPEVTTPTPMMQTQEPTHPQMKTEQPQKKPEKHPEQPKHPEKKPEVVTEKPQNESYFPEWFYKIFQIDEPILPLWIISPIFYVQQIYIKAFYYVYRVIIKFPKILVRNFIKLSFSSQLTFYLRIVTKGKTNCGKLLNRRRLEMLYGCGDHDYMNIIVFILLCSRCLNKSDA